MTIPAEIEKMILEGRAEFSAVTHNADMFIIDPPDEGYQIIFGFQVHPPSFENSVKYQYSILVASDNAVQFYQVKQNSEASPPANGQSGPTDFIHYNVTENPVSFTVLVQEQGGPDDLDFSNNFLDSLPIGYLPTSFLGYSGPYLVASTAPVASPDALYYLPFGQPFTNNNFPGVLANPDGLGFNSWYLHPKDVNQPGTLVFPNTFDLENSGWTSVLGITVYSVKVREPLPTRTKNKFVI